MDYRSFAKKEVRFPDLSQYPKNGRGRGELVDGSLMTLTTQSTKVFSQDWGSNLFAAGSWPGCFSGVMPI